LIFQIDLKVADGQLETFKGLVAEIVSFIKTEESATLIYNWYISEDNHKDMLPERYKNNQTTIKHVYSFISEIYVDHLMSICTFESITILGEASDELKETLKDFTEDLRNHIGGFVR
jgi:quinol monooxygenase YgiN